MLVEGIICLCREIGFIIKLNAFPAFHFQLERIEIELCSHTNSARNEAFFIIRGASF